MHYSLFATLKTPNCCTVADIEIFRMCAKFGSVTPWTDFGAFSRFS